jgi:NAD(P)H-dependent FMN reductase
MARSDAVLIAAPEYAGGVAGTIKNALDWIVGSGELDTKPVAGISAGTSGGAFARQPAPPTTRR